MLGFGEDCIKGFQFPAILCWEEEVDEWDQDNVETREAKVLRCTELARMFRQSGSKDPAETLNLI